MVAAAIAASAVVGAGASLYGSSKAASSAKDASNISQNQYERTRNDLSSYFVPGIRAYGNALTLAESGPTGGGPDYIEQARANIPLQMTQEQLEQTPGYQFTRDQGLASVRAQNAARGLGMSTAALKGAATYATGLANKTYLDQFNVAQKRFEDYLNLNTGQQGNVQGNFNRLSAMATIGENAAAQAGTIGQNAADTSGKYINAAGLNQAAGLQNATNALTSGANNYAAYDAYKQRVGLSGYGDPNSRP